MNIAKLRKLSYEEVAKCSRCGFCLPSCPVYQVERKESATPRGRNAITRAVIEGRLENGELVRLDVTPLSRRTDVIVMGAN